ncbi:MAG: hypothetical protein ACI80P_001496 [Flavobacteriales bacterium]
MNAIFYVGTLGRNLISGKIKDEEVCIYLRNNQLIQTATTMPSSWVDRFAKLLDSEFQIPGTDMKFGLDPIIGLIPGLGNILGYVASSAVVIGIVKEGVSGMVIVKMLFNILLDMLIGLVPVLGTFFDFVFKANDRNIELLREYQAEIASSVNACDTIIVGSPKEKGSVTVLVIVAVLAALSVLFVVLLFLVMSVTMRIISAIFN